MISLPVVPAHTLAHLCSPAPSSALTIVTSLKIIYFNISVVNTLHVHKDNQQLVIEACYKTLSYGNHQLQYDLLNVTPYKKSIRSQWYTAL